MCRSRRRRTTRSRLLRPEEAIQVSQCIYRAWGYSYPNDDLYYPDRIVHLNATGELVSIVAVDAAGNVVGHYALERPDLGPIAETAQAVVSPAHRGRKLMERMRTFLEAQAGRLGLVGVYGQPVSSHTSASASRRTMACTPVASVWVTRPAR